MLGRLDVSNVAELDFGIKSQTLVGDWHGSFPLQLEGVGPEARLTRDSPTASSESG